MSIKYGRIPTKNAEGIEGFRYTKNGLMTKESRVPHDVMEKFQYTPTVEYDDAPERRRCIFCDAPQSHQRVLSGQPVDLCGWHYQNKNLGKIAQQVRELEKEQAVVASKPIIKKKKRRKTALSAIVT